ncbi:MAG: TIGR00341 family protein [Magnetococcales bacterium]|nr:TIGR00341 family protein [Magnetococcales bacterium]
MMKSWHIIHDGSCASVKTGEYGEPVVFSKALENATLLPGKNAQVFLYLDDANLKNILPIAMERDWDIAPLPHPHNPLCQRRFRLNKDLAKERDHALKTQPISIKLLTCNGIPVLSSIVAGKWLTCEMFQAFFFKWSIFVALIRKIRTLESFKISINTAKGQTLTTAGVGFIVLTGPDQPYLGTNLKNLPIFDDTRTTLFVMAPRSSLEVLLLLLRLMFLHTINLENLPTSLGLIRSQSVAVNVERGVDLVVDGALMSAKSMMLESSQTPLRIRCGQRYPSLENFSSPTKDSLRVNRLPTGGSVALLSGKPLPLFNHATEDEFRDLFLALKESAMIGNHFMVLTVLSAFLALFGLYSDSSPVIIGAMILAPLMGPIISLSMGLARGHILLIRESLKTLATGIGLALLCGTVVATGIPLRTLTQEMAARLSPNLLDLGIAVVSGMAGAYASAREELTNSLAGVAIAVALVPPLCVVGIGLGWMDWEVILGASLLFTTNLVGIAVSASLTFLALGFAPFRLAKAGLVWSVSLLALVSIPLYFAFDDVLERNRILDILSAPEVTHHLREAVITPLAVHLGQETVIQIQITSRDLITGHDLENVRNLFIERLGRPVIVETSMIMRR